MLNGGGLNFSGGLAGLNGAIGALPSLAAFDALASQVQAIMDSGRTILSAPGDTGIWKHDKTTSPPLATEWFYPSEVGWGWAPPGSRIIDQFSYRHVFSKRPFDIDIRPDGRRALAANFQTGNVSVMDLDYQTAFMAPPAGGFGALATLDTEMFHGIVGVTPALDLDNHLWPLFGAINAPGNLVPSPHETRIFTWDVEYAQNGKFAAVAHSGKGVPQMINGQIPDFTNIRKDYRFRLAELGFSNFNGDTAIAPDGSSVSIFDPFTFQRGGGSVSILKDEAISDDFDAHIADTGFGSGNVERPYYTVSPIGESAMRFIHEYEPDKYFTRPRGVAIQPFLTWASPLFGDQVEVGTGMQIRWRDERIEKVAFRLLKVDPVTCDLTEQGVTPNYMLTQQEQMQKSFRTTFRDIVMNATGNEPTTNTRYRIEAEIITGTAGGANNDTLSTEWIEVDYAPLASVVNAKELKLRPFLVVHPATMTQPGDEKQLRVFYRDSAGGAENEITSNTNIKYGWLGNNPLLLDGSPLIDAAQQVLVDEMIDIINTKLKESSPTANIEIKLAKIDISATGQISVMEPGIELVLCRYENTISNPIVVLAGIELDELKLAPLSASSVLMDGIKAAFGKDGGNTPMILIENTPMGGVACSNGQITVEDVVFKFLGAVTLSQRDLLEALEKVLDKAILKAAASAAPATGGGSIAAGLAAAVVTKVLVTLIDTSLSVALAQALDPIESEDPNVATVTGQGFKGFVTGHKAGVTGVSGTLDMGDFGKKSDTVKVWVLPAVDDIFLRPECSVTSIQMSPSQGPVIRTEVFFDLGSTSQTLNLPPEIDDINEFLNIILPGGTDSWTNGSIDKTFEEGRFQFRVQGSYQISASQLDFKDMSIAFTAPNSDNFIDLTYTPSDPNLIDIVEEGPFAQRIRHMGQAGFTTYTVELDIPCMGTFTKEGKIYLIDYPPGQEVVDKNLVNISIYIPPGDPIEYELFYFNPLDQKLVNVYVFDELLLNGQVVESRAIYMGNVSPYEAVMLPVTFTMPSTVGQADNVIIWVSRTISHDPDPPGPTPTPTPPPPPPPIPSPTPTPMPTPPPVFTGPSISWGIVFNEFVLDPQSDWNDSMGGDMVPFNSTPGVGAITGADRWLELGILGFPIFAPGIDFEHWDIEYPTTTGTNTVNVGPFTVVGGDYIIWPLPADFAPTGTIKLMTPQGLVFDEVDIGAEFTSLGPSTAPGDEAIALQPDRGVGVVTLPGGVQFVRQAATIGASN